MRARLRRFFAPPIFRDEETTRTAQTLAAVGWTLFAVVFLLMLSRIFSGVWNSESSKVFFPGVLLLTLTAQGLIRAGRVRLAGILLVGLLWTALTVQASFSDGLRDATLLAYPILVLMSALFLGWREGLAVGLLSFAMIWVFAVREQMGVQGYAIDPPLSYAADLSAVFITTSVLTYILIQRLNRFLSESKLELKERLRAEERLQRQARYFTALHETTFGLLNRLELNPLLESILARAGELLDTPHVGIDLVLPDESGLRQELGSGEFAKWNKTVIQSGQGVVGQIWQEGKTLLIQDYEAFEDRLAVASHSGFVTVAGVPLKSETKVIGTLVVAYRERERVVTPEEVAVLERLAALASLAIVNARLYESAQVELRERMAVERDLRDSEERFRKAFNNNQVAVSIVTLEDGVFLEANDAFWKLTALTPEQALGRSAVELNLWERPEDRAQFVRDLLEQGSLADVEVKFAGNGQSRFTLGYYELIAIKERLCILCMFSDVSEKKKAQQDLKESESRMRAILAAIPDMIFEISKEGVLLDFMASASLTPLMEPREFIGKNIQDLFPPAIARQTLFALERALATGQVHAFEYGLPPGEEIQFFEARVAPVTPQAAIIMARDISQRKWVETEREKLIAELEGKNAELERFTYTVSHDLKSPIITIRGFLGFLERDALSGNLPRLQSDIKRIADAADKMQTLLNELLELSRVGRLVNPSQTIPFNEIAAEALELVAGRIQENRVVVRAQDNMPPVFGDRPRLVEALQNLLDNAAKFIRADPQIEIGCAGGEGGLIVFFVRDNGIGIPTEHHDRIFGLFNKLDGDSEGTGVGLALVKRIIEFHQGRIWVESEPGVGSAFFFTLPPAPPPEPET